MRRNGSPSTRTRKPSSASSYVHGNPISAPHRAAEAVDEYPFVELLGGHGLGHELRHVWIIDGVGRVAAEVGDVVAERGDRLLDERLRAEAAVIRAHDDLHRGSTPAGARSVK